jgi:glycosyltransferase involved in cell wall biosynthesis
MKVLYIGHYRDGTGWGNAALNNILSLDAAGVEVVPRAITYEVEDRVKNSRIAELERNDNKNCDIVIQHTLPSNYCYDSSYKNIGCLTVESSDFITTGWQHNINMMDEVWTCSEASKSATFNSGVTKPVKVVPYAIDLSKYKENNGEKIQELQNQFTFGFVGEFIERKNIKALVQAFHLEFDPREPVNMFIKTSKTSLADAQKYLSHIKSGMKIRTDYKEEVVIAGMMPEDDYISVLNQVDCFVMPSRGEAFCIPSLEAMALGIPSIWTEGIGMEHSVGIKVKSYDKPCFGAIETLSNLDTAMSTWKEIDILDLAKAMREMYETSHKYKEECLSQSKKYTYENIGKMMKGLLNDS